MSRGKTGILALYKSRANRYIASAIILTIIPSYLKMQHKMRLFGCNAADNAFNVVLTSERASTYYFDGIL